MFRLGDIKAITPWAPFLLKALQKLLGQTPEGIPSTARSGLKSGLYVAIGQLINRLPKAVESSLLPIFKLLLAALNSDEADGNVLSAVQGNKLSSRFPLPFALMISLQRLWFTFALLCWTLLQS